MKVIQNAIKKRGLGASEPRTPKNKKLKPWWLS